MPKRGSQDWLSRAAWGLTSGVLALSLLTAGGGGAPATGARSALAEDIDCYNDKDLYDLPECVERRALDKKNGMSQNESQGATNQSTDQQGGESQQSSGGGSQPSSGQQQASGGSNQPSGGQQQASGGGQQQASGGGQPSAGSQPSAASQPQQQQTASSDDDEDAPEKPRGPLTDPKQAVLTFADAGKEATQYINEEGSDKYGPFARTRFERDRSNGASALGPNVMDSKVWVAKDADSAKALFKEQAAITNFPERKEKVDGPVEKIKPTAYGDDFSFSSGFYQDGDNKVWQHYRFEMRVGNVVSVLYLFGREDFFQDSKDRTWTGQGDWFTSTIFHRM